MEETRQEVEDTVVDYEQVSEPLQASRTPHQACDIGESENHKAGEVAVKPENAMECESTSDVNSPCEKQKSNTGRPLFEEFSTLPSSRGSPILKLMTASASKAAQAPHIVRSPVDKNEELCQDDDSSLSEVPPRLAHSSASWDSSAETESDPDDSPSLHRARNAVFALPERAYTPTGDTMSIADWRVRGRFLEYRLVYKSDPEDCPPRWVRAQRIDAKRWQDRIKYFFNTNPSEKIKFHAVLGHDHGSGKVQSTYGRKVCGVDGKDLINLVFYTSDDNSTPGGKYDIHKGHELDRDAWQSAVALYWRERLYAIQQYQVEHIMEKYDMKSKGPIKSVDYGECTSKIVQMDTGDEFEAAIPVFLDEA